MFFQSFFIITNPIYDYVRKTANYFFNLKYEDGNNREVLYESLEEVRKLRKPKD